MQNKIKKIGTVIVSLLIMAVLLTAIIMQLMITPSGNERYFSGAAERYCQDLIAKGFPNDYAVALTELHLLHPNWEFIPLLITEQKSTYNWNYVIDRETEDGELNVIYKSDTYAPYHHPLNKEIYDNGYYQASRDTVEYFMDPRNFLNEVDVFQFYTLSGNSSATKKQVEAVLAGTFMEESKLENGLTYAEYFMELGKEFDINPIFLAAKVRQEQGTAGTSPIISGVCGTKLHEFYINQTEKSENGSAVLPPTIGSFQDNELLSLNGYYNPFNVGATGTGLFKIYYNAMKRAQTGTPEKADEWGNGGAWNTQWKALYGGAYFLKKNYIDRYQSTVYLQKFDVDGRSESNFSHQYMTAVFGAMGEGRSLYQSFASLDALDSPASFLIPVYADMPDTICADPADGACSVTAQATKKYTYRSDITSPQRQVAENEPLYLTCDTHPNAMLKLAGVVTHSYRVEELEYSWNGGEWQPASDGKNLNVSLFVDEPESSAHILVIRGRTCYETSGNTPQTVNTYFLYAVIYVNVNTPPSVKLSFEVGNTLTEHTVYAGNEVTLPSCNATDFAGWYGSDGSFFPADTTLIVQNDIKFSAIFLDFQIAPGAAISTLDPSPSLRFSVFFRNSEYERLASTNTLSLSATMVAEETHTPVTNLQLCTVTASNDLQKKLTRLDAYTDPLESSAYNTLYYAEFHITLSYTNGTERTMTLSTASFARSAKQVAQLALNDTQTDYAPQRIDFLQSVIE